MSERRAIDQPLGTLPELVAYDPAGLSPLSVTRLVEAAVGLLAAADAITVAAGVLDAATLMLSPGSTTQTLNPPADRLREQLVAIGAIAASPSQESPTS